MNMIWYADPSDVIKMRKKLRLEDEHAHEKEHRFIDIVSAQPTGYESEAYWLDINELLGGEDA